MTDPEIAKWLKAAVGALTYFKDELVADQEFDLAMKTREVRDVVERIAERFTQPEPPHET
jgi:hypothetical protein